MDIAIHWINHYPVDSVFFFLSLTLIHWIAIYLKHIPCSYRFIEALVKVWENENVGQTASVFTAFSSSPLLSRVFLGYTPLLPYTHFLVRPS